MQYWPRKRARRIYPRCRSWPEIDETKPLGFYGYKVEMLHAIVLDNRLKSRTKGEKIAMPITLIECPPLNIYSIRLYKQTDHGLKAAKEIVVSNDKLLARKIPVAKELKQELSRIDITEFDDLRLIVYTSTHQTPRGQKTPEMFELALGGSLQNKFEFAKQHIGKQLRVSDVFAEGEQVDVAGVTKGKGFQGTVKRFGVGIKQHKSEKTKRGAGNLGAWTPSHVLPTVPQPGKMGFHTRTEKNKWLVKISNEPINPVGGFNHYGPVKNEYILLKGSVPGPPKRLIRLYKAKRPSKRYPTEPPQIESISLVTEK